MKISEFAEKAGITVKTLLHYDKIGLLQPSEKTDAGYRIYSNKDFIRLQQILTLKFIGLSLEEIKKLLNENNNDVSSLITIQKKALEEKKRRIEAVINALEKAENAINDKKPLTVEQLIDIIKATTMAEKSKEWVLQFFPEEQLKEIAERLYAGKTKEELQEMADETGQFMEEIRNSLHLDPASPKAQELAKRWKKHLDQFTQGKPEIEEKVNEMYRSLDQIPPELKTNPNWNPEIIKFINKALDIYNKNH